MARPKDDAKKVLVRNKRVRHDYEIEQTIEAGMVLSGGEVKSLRAAEATLTDSFAQERNGEMWLIGLEIQPYRFAHGTPHEPRRDRRLLLHRAEIKKLSAKIKEKGLSLIPTEVYVKEGRLKIELALGRGKREFEKRDTLKKKEAQREMERRR